MNSKNIDGKILRTMVLTGAVKLEVEKFRIDSLNVFPVPDGDTGTNMSLTLFSAAKAIEKLPEEAQLTEVANALAYGALMGARGNSGVILSQLLGGFAKAIGDAKEIDTLLLAKCFKMGVEAAYKAVVKPIEGTILTVAREATDKLGNEVKDFTDIESCLESFLKQGYITLEKTPDMLPVLRQAGVVDAGGQGFLNIIEGMLEGFKGNKITAPIASEITAKGGHSVPVSQYKIIDEDIHFQYCTELIIKKHNHSSITTSEIRAFLEEKGDCVVVVEAEDIIKIHVHTNNPGLVLEYSCNLGTMHDIKIQNMREQSKEMQLKLPSKLIGVVAVGVGEGIGEIFRSLGVDYIITGGQTMNPSTEDIVTAINEVNAQQIIILPNNKNIILAAQQAVVLVEKPAQVISTKTIPQGISALMAFNGELDLETNYKKMQEASKNVRSCEITYAVRDAQHGDLFISSGQIMSIIDGEISHIGNEIHQVIVNSLDNLIINNNELITLYYGSDVSDEEAKELLKKLSSLFPDIDFELHYGGQPLYYYFISIE
ncbi:MAG: DAK2 domain-containing protein [Bacillota bacterium]